MRRRTTRDAFLMGAVALAFAACTTSVEPARCEPGSTQCAGIHDARFCDYVAIAVEGTGCAALGIAPSKQFCIATTACLDTSYVVAGRDCRVRLYHALSDNARYDCPPGVPTFVTR